MPLDLANPDRKINVGIILTGGITEILDVAPIDLIHGMTPELIAPLPLPEPMKAQALDLAFFWITEHGKPARMSSGATMQATHSFANAPTIDIALMGAHNLGYNPSETELAYVRKVFDECAAFLTICGGFENLLRAGLLVGKTATAPRFMLPQLQKDAPNTKWVEQRWARDGKVWTTGALLCGPGMMRAFAQDTWHNKPEMVNIMLDIGNAPGRETAY
ncbi:class I glutamine amidotransferase-like protein [Neohortaea acidophila]|uniref:Class I glutamine amidotransferase-like protein n=1 Tax=Neohortaea acidophila TaxID=245834 RepID=A0A6A6PT42_9PEZI|nr:class I glutamine amidotransferase-like protein [Neohortaea acidophila]KAF2482397.1 class I glutamine amidotransferase-like protein [Neohortaea acidophila]